MTTLTLLQQFTGAPSTLKFSSLSLYSSSFGAPLKKHNASFHNPRWESSPAASTSQPSPPIFGHASPTCSKMSSRRSGRFIRLGANQRSYCKICCSNGENASIALCSREVDGHEQAFSKSRPNFLEEDITHTAAAAKDRASGCAEENSAALLQESFLPGNGKLLYRDSPGKKIGLGSISQMPVAFFTERATLVKLAVMVTGFLALQPCFAVWAAPDTEQINLFGLDGLSDIQGGFASAFLLIFFAEIGDKTFFIAALLATRKSNLAVFSGTFGALAIMTVISVFLGRVFHYIDGALPGFGDTKLPLDDIAAVVLLIYFGVSTLVDAASMEDSDNGEEQQEAELAIAGVGTGGPVAATVATTFALVFVAEWGDKSFFSTIALSAASSPLGVVTGAIAGHGAATLLAVLGGSFLGNYISEKLIAYVGGILFLVFAGVTLFEIFN